jgi:nucleoid-associated protein YgaU
VIELATLTNLSKEKASPIYVQFNPTDYAIDRGVVYADMPVPGLRMPLLQFVRGESNTLTLDLFLDGTDARASTDPEQTVEKRLEHVREFVTIASDLHAPPVCLFQWHQTKFQGVVTSMKEKYQLFDETGKVLRARVTLTLKSFEAAEVQLREMNRNSPDRTRVRVVRDGDTLSSIAREAYGDPRLWRPIAELNGIDRPRFLVAGTALRIPSL